MIDSNNDGGITTEEYLNFMPAGTKKEDVDKVFTLMDSNNDQKVDF